MKVSELILEIVNMAEEKYGISSHKMDIINVSFYPNGDDGWYVWLERPTTRSLNMMGEHSPETAGTIKMVEIETRFLTAGDTLVKALLTLQDTIEMTDWDE